MKYTQLPPTYKDDVIAEAMYARELEYFHYEFDAINFRRLIAVLPDGAYKAGLVERLESTLIQMQNVDATYEALAAQISSPEAHAEAVLRTTEKRKAENEVRAS